VQAIGITSSLPVENGRIAQASAEQGLTASFAQEAIGCHGSVVAKHVDFSLLRLKLEYRLKSEHHPAIQEVDDSPIHSEILFGPTEFTLPKVENALKEVGFKTVRYGTNLLAMDQQYDRPLTVLFETLVDNQTQIHIQIANKIR